MQTRLANTDLLINKEAALLNRIETRRPGFFVVLMPIVWSTYRQIL